MTKKRHRRHRRSRRRETSGAWKVVTAGGASAIVGALVIAALMSAPTPTATEPAEQPSTAATVEPEPEPQGVVIVGDSNTSMGAQDLAAGQIGSGAWAYYALRTSGYQFAGGWAAGGSTSVTQAEELEPVEDADVLLVMTGTNDLGQSVPFNETAASLDTMADKISVERVVLLAIPPRDEETTPTSSDFNESLQELASDRGWEFFDGLEFLRSPDGGFTEETTTDGIHLTAEALREFGQTVTGYLVE